MRNSVAPPSKSEESTPEHEGNDAEVIAAARERYRKAKKTLNMAIAEAKIKAWEKLLLELNKDPWVRAYRNEGIHCIQ